MSTVYAAPEDAVPEQLQSGRQFYREQRWAEAIEILAQALAETEDNRPRLRGEVLFLRGMAQVQAGAEAEGIEGLEAAATAGWLEARFQLALLYARQGRRRGALRQQAIDHLELLIEADDSDPSLVAGGDRVAFALGGR